jgi:hypothetical protein
MKEKERREELKKIWAGDQNSKLTQSSVFEEEELLCF